MTTLDLADLTVTHGDTVLVEVERLTLQAGRPLTVIGESGSGKSLLAHALMGTLAPELGVSGRMLLDGEPHDLADTAARRRLWGGHLALLPQEPALALDPTMRVGGQVAEGVPGFHRRRREARARAEAVLDGLGLARTARAFPHTLSGGMAQRVAYAAATVGGARVLIVDEPSKGLDQGAVDRLAELLAEHVAAGGLLLTITHDLRLARRLGGEVAVMREAGFVEQGAADHVLGSPGQAYTRRLVAADPARWRHPWSASTAGRTAPGHRGDEPLIAATGLAKSYGATELFQDVSLSIRPGERWALTGPSGVGKTTLGDILLGLTPVDRGTVHHDPSARGARLQKLYQDPALSFPPRVRLEQAMADVLRRHRVPRERLESLLAELGLPTGLLARRPGQVSGGELQRLAIVRAMLVSPALVFADEATSRLDLITQERTVDCLMSELSGTGCALLMVTHDHDLAAAVAEHRLDLGSGDDGHGPGVATPTTGPVLSTAR